MSPQPRVSFLCALPPNLFYGKGIVGNVLAFSKRKYYNNGSSFHVQIMPGKVELNPVGALG